MKRRPLAGLHALVLMTPWPALAGKRSGHNVVGRFLAILAITATMLVASLSPGTALAAPCDDPPDNGGGWVCAQYTGSAGPFTPPSGNAGEFYDNTNLAWVARWSYNGYYWYNKTVKHAVVTDPHDGNSGDGHSVLYPNTAYGISGVISTWTSQCKHWTNALCDTWYWETWSTLTCWNGVQKNIDYWVNASYAGYTTHGEDGNVDGCA